MSGICSLILTILATYSTFFSGSTGTERVKVYLWVAAGLTFLFANYRAWKAEHQKVVSGLPKFYLNVEHVNWELVANGSVTAFVFAVYLLNRGAPSIATGWRATYQVAKSVEDMELIYLTGPWVLRADAQTVTLQPEDQIGVKTVERRVETGEAKTGRIFFRLQGNRTDQIKSLQFKITISFSDFLGHRTETTFTPSPVPLTGIRRYPGEQGTISTTPPESASYTPLPPPVAGE